MLYWSLLAFFCLLYPLKKCKFCYPFLNIVSGNDFYIFLVGITLIFFAGARASNVGADTEMYKEIFVWASNGKSFFQEYNSWHRGGTEPLFYLLTYVSSKFLCFNAYLTIVAIISIFPILYVISKYSRNIYFSIFIYIAFGYYPFVLSGIRQAIGIGICMLAFDATIQKNIKKFIFYIIIGCLFHKTVLLFIPVYIIFSLKKQFMWIYIIIVALVLVFLLRYQIFSILNIFSRNSYDIASSEQGGYRMFYVMIFTASIGWFYYYKFIVHTNDKNSFLSWGLLLMMSISVLMWPVANLNAELNRMYYYYHIFLMLFLPNLIHSIRLVDRMLLILFFCIIGFYYLQFYIIEGELKYSPYITFWND